MPEPKTSSRAGASRVRRATADRHFDGLADKFERGFYTTERGRVRLALTQRLMDERFSHLPPSPVLEIGAGLGQTAHWWLTRGHHLTLIEPSGEMRERAKRFLSTAAPQGQGLSAGTTADQSRAAQAASDPQVPGQTDMLSSEEPFAGQLVWEGRDLQGFAAETDQRWPVVVCHAVLEWLVDPREGFALLAKLLAPGGVMSLSVFNRDALAFSNVSKGNFDKVLEGRLAGWGTGKRLTPISPLRDGEIRQWAAEAGLEVRELTGLRVFHDYLRSRDPLSAADMQKLLALECQHWRTPPFVYLGRYLHYELVRPA